MSANNDGCKISHCFISTIAWLRPSLNPMMTLLPCLCALSAARRRVRGGGQVRRGDPLSLQAMGAQSAGDPLDHPGAIVVILDMLQLATATAREVSARRHHVVRPRDDRAGGIERVTWGRERGVPPVAGHTVPPRRKPDDLVGEWGSWPDRPRHEVVGDHARPCAHCRALVQPHSGTRRRKRFKSAGQHRAANAGQHVARPPRSRARRYPAR